MAECPGRSGVCGLENFVGAKARDVVITAADTVKAMMSKILGVVVIVIIVLIGILSSAAV